MEINYKKAPQFSFVFNWLNEFLTKEYSLIGDLASESVMAIAKLLELPVMFKNASSINYKNDVVQNGQQKILNLCKILQADKYINPKNGIDLYDRNLFNSENIELRFINMHEIKYPQFKKDGFVPNLSIIDVMMFNDIGEIQQLLCKYSLN